MVEILHGFLIYAKKIFPLGVQGSFGRAVFAPWWPRHALNHTSASNQNYFSEGPGQICFYKKMRYFITPRCVCPSVRLSLCPSVRLSVCPSVRLSVCPSVRLSRSEEHTSELQSHHDLVCRLLLEKKKK